MRVRRILSVSEAGVPAMPYPRPMAAGRGMAAIETADIEPGEQRLTVALTVSFELE